MAVAMERQLAPAACFEGGGQQVQGLPLLEREKMIVSKCAGGGRSGFVGGWPWCRVDDSLNRKW